MPLHPIFLAIHRTLLDIENRSALGSMFREHSLEEALDIFLRFSVLDRILKLKGPAPRYDNPNSVFGMLAHRFGDVLSV